MIQLRDYISSRNILEFRANRGSSKHKELFPETQNPPTKNEILGILDNAGFYWCDTCIGVSDLIRISKIEKRNVLSLGPYSEELESHYIIFCFYGDNHAYMITDRDAIKKMDVLGKYSSIANFAIVYVGPEGRVMSNFDDLKDYKHLARAVNAHYSEIQP